MADGSRSLPLPFEQELVVDLFAGGGGASLGLARAYRDPDIAVNHNPIAIAVHTANHPNTRHFTCDVFEVDPVAATGGQPVGVLWASPDCRHHSKAKGGKPRSKKIRGLAWVVIKWAKAVRPRLIHLENVEEFADWGPLLKDGSPCKERKGITFRRWVRQLERLGYRVEHRERVAANAGAPTIRKRLYIIARCDGLPIVWPVGTHAKGGAGGLKPWRTAAECIDFALPAKSIFGRPKPLAVNTQKRIAKGLWRYVLNCAKPFIVPLRGTSAAHTATHGTFAPLSTVTGGGTHHALVSPVVVGCGGRMGQSPPRGVDAPFQTITAKADACIAGASLAPFLTEHANGSTQRVFDAQEPMRTQVAQIKGGHFALVAPHITKFRTNAIGSAMDEPLHTVTAGGDMKRPAGAAHAMGMVSAFFEQANGGFYEGDGRAASEPLSTICASGSNQRLVHAYFVKYYSTGGQWQDAHQPMHTVPTKDRIGLVQVVQVDAESLAPELRDRAKACADFLHEYLPEHFPQPADMVLLGDYVLVDITLRMLVPRELARAQGFPDSYILERGWFVDEKSPAGEWRPVTKTDQVRLIGNSVCPAEAEALAAANIAPLKSHYAREAA